VMYCPRRPGVNRRTPGRSIALYGEMPYI